MSGKAFFRIEETFDEGSAALDAMSREPISDRPAFQEIVAMVGSGIRVRFRSASPPDSPDTRERKDWGPIKRSGKFGATGSLTGTLFSSGQTFAQIEERSTDVSAAVKNAAVNYWMWMHERGKGYSYWTIAGRKGGGKKRTKGARDTKRASERKGATTTYPERSIFFLTSTEQTFAVNRISQAVEDSMLRKWNGPAV